MFVVTEAEADAIRAVYQQRGEFAAAVELRRLFPGVTDNVQARECARTIAGWKPLPVSLPCCGADDARRIGHQGQCWVGANSLAAPSRARTTASASVEGCPNHQP